jgi:hypothetical protein
MKHVQNVDVPDFSMLKDTPSLRAFIVYENLASGKRAKEVCDRLTESLGPGWNIEIEMYSYRSFRMLALRRIAATAATHANLVIFSCHGEELPVEVSEWTEHWLAHPVCPTALVALLTGAPDQTRKPYAVEKHLTDLAQRRGMQYFSHLYIPAADARAAHLMPVMQMQPNDESSSSTPTRNDHFRGL